jgi:hypothetical protein
VLPAGREALTEGGLLHIPIAHFGSLACGVGFYFV